MSENIEYLLTLGSPAFLAKVTEEYSGVDVHPNTIRYWSKTGHLRPDMAEIIRKALTLYYADMITKVSRIRGDGV